MQSTQTIDPVVNETSARTPEEVSTYKQELFKTLYQARYILAKIGTMPERQMARRQLKLMEKSIKGKV